MLDVNVGSATTGQYLQKQANGFWENVDLTADVESVNGQTGVVVLTYSDVGAASEAQGDLAETALQPGDEVVQSVNSKTGDVVLTAADVGALPDDTALDFVPLGSWAALPAL